MYEHNLHGLITCYELALPSSGMRSAACSFLVPFFSLFIPLSNIKIISRALLPFKQELHDERIYFDL